MSPRGCPAGIGDNRIAKRKGLVFVPFLFHCLGKYIFSLLFFLKGEKMKLTRRHIWIFLTVLIFAAIVWFIAVQWDKLASLFRMLILGVIIAYIFTPLCDVLERKLSRIWAIAVIVLTMAALLIVIALFFLPRMADEIMELVERFPVLMESIRDVLSNIQAGMDTMGIPDGIQDSINAYSSTFQEKATRFIMNFLDRSVIGVSSLPSLFMGFVLGFYFLKDREYFARVLTNIIPIRSRRTIVLVASQINHILHCFIRGEVFTAAVVGALATTAYLIIGLPYALLLGFLAALFEFIPYFGPWIGAAPALILAYLAGPGKFLWSVVAILLIQQLENVFISPKILGNVVSLHPVYIILALWTGGQFFGIAGMFLAVPAVLILRVIIKHIYLSIVAIK